MPELRDMLARSFSDPQSVARDILALNLPMGARFLAMMIVVILTALLGTLAQIVFTQITKVDMGEITSPIAVVGLQAALILYGAAVLSFIGQRFGGTGRFSDAVVLISWIEFVLMIGQMIQVLLMVFFPISATIMSVLLIGLLFFLLVQFTMVLHGFENPFAVAVGVLLGFIGSAVVAGLILVSTGLVQMPAGV
ncbi:hypothetical protein FGG78_06725 [Thioclava sp. BHET1]|uniref:Yip1 domain-containing protein n=1 Tax=Thioclava dalianensis TaxID=1185766 RepID=A0A074TJI2_9RHOB|nr:YIP1 family protein [Thioclava dalianensis]KEP71769.1 hypothetical protein DL1_00705 [Thioclava dalianensis]TMV92972.1 hypothetical protein FGG78_06725 [Thioclava sp. BHET1]SFN44409.1 Yip1 domain-containing protein [Thioclava dalianensis]